METKYKEIPFDVNRINEEGVQVITRDGRNVKILCTDCNGINDKKLVALIDNISNEFPVQLHEDGHFYSNQEDGYDLIMLVPCKPKRMTNQELSHWFRDCPEEHREWKYDCFKTRDLVYSTYEYHQHDANKECPEDILIRRNGGAWEEPLIED